MTSYAYAAGRRAWDALPRVRAWLEGVRPAALLAPAIAVQWLATLALALTVRHNGWLYYQGGDQVWYYASGWLLGHGTIPQPLIGPGWPALLAPFAVAGGPTLVPALPAIVLFDVLVLGPVALLCVWGIADRLGGRVFAYWATLLWLSVPFIGIKYADAGYHQRYTELTLPQSFGLTILADFPSMVAALVAVYFALRVLDRHDAIDAVAAGLAAGLAIAIKPSNTVFLAGPLLGFAYRRRFVSAAYAAAGLAPAVITLALWKYRGYGYLPLFHAQGAARLALGAQHELVGLGGLHNYIHLNWHRLNLNLQEIKEHFWSMRVIEWLVVAGLIGLARRSLTALLVVGGWFTAFVLTKGTYAYSSVNDASLFRTMMPSFPAFVLMLAALVFLLPGARRGAAPAATRPSPLTVRRRLGLLGAAAAVFAVSPLALVAAASPLRGPAPRAYVVNGLLRTIDPSLRLSASIAGGTVRLRWDAAQPSAARVFYRIWRSGAADGGASCTPRPHAADDCKLVMDDRGATASGTFADTPGRGRWTYRLALAANWLDSPDYGDVYAIGPPVRVRLR